MTANAVIYARMSTGEQGESPAQQEAACRANAVRLGVTVSEVFTDEAVSGSRVDRPEYLRMLKAAKAGEFSTLLLWKQNRLGRDQPEVERAIRQLEHLKVRVVSCNGYDTLGQTEKNRKLLRGITGLVDQVYLDDLSEDTHRGQSAQFRKGYWVGGKVYGYDLAKVVDVSQTDAFGDPKKIGTGLKINAAEAKVVREIYHLYADIGLSTDAIAATLNARGIASPGASWKNRKVRRSDGKWLGSTIVGMLANPLYFGDYRWNVSKWVKDPETGAKKRLERPAEEVLQQYKPEWRIFTDATLRDRVQVTRVRRARIRGAAISSGIANAKRIGGADSRFWLGSILKCGVCGANYIGDSARDYVCPGHKPGACSNDMRVRRDAVNEAVYAVVKSHLLSQDAIARTRRELEAHFKALEREEEVALRKGANSKALLKLDKQIAEVRSNDWPQSAKAGAISAFEGEREAITSRTKGAAGERTNRARALLAKVPAMVEDYRRTVETGFKVLAEPKNVSKARELLRGWLMNGTIVLTPNAAHTAIVGRVEFAGLEEQFLNWAGFKRKVGTRPRKPRNAPTSHVTMVAGACFDLNLMRISRKKAA